MKVYFILIFRKNILFLNKKYSFLYIFFYRNIISENSQTYVICDEGSTILLTGKIEDV
jgi:hypothetical protein